LIFSNDRVCLYIPDLNVCTWMVGFREHFSICIIG
jgi:hypothetical protein